MTEDESVATSDLALVRAAKTILRDVSGEYESVDHARAELARLESILAARVEAATA